MNVGLCSPRPILESCRLDGHEYQIDPYVGCEHDCRYCYALNRAESDWTRRILVHPDLERRLAFELENVAPQSIYLGMNSDPYQPVEETRLQTRRVLEMLVDRGFSVCVLTKSPRIVRDVDLFLEMPDAYLGVSIAFGDETDRRRFEPAAPPNEARVHALRTLKSAGLRTYVLVCPVMPHITDVERIVADIAGWVEHAYVYRLRMERETDVNWRNVERVLKRHYPDLVDAYRGAAFSDVDPYWRDLRSRLAALAPPDSVELSIEV